MIDFFDNPAESLLSQRAEDCTQGDETARPNPQRLQNQRRRALHSQRKTTFTPKVTSVSTCGLFAQLQTKLDVIDTSLTNFLRRRITRAPCAGPFQVGPRPVFTREFRRSTFHEPGRISRSQPISPTHRPINIRIRNELLGQ
jgi:hypothetical protein